MAMQLGGETAKRGGFTESSDINVTPFVDVMLVLLIIFMVAVPLAAVNVKVNYPDSNAKADQAPKQPIYLSIPAAGAFYVGDHRFFTVSELGDQLERETPPARRDATRVLIRAESEIPYKVVLDVLNRLRDGGFYKVALVGHSSLKKRE